MTDLWGMGIQVGWNAQEDKEESPYTNSTIWTDILNYMDM